MDLLSSAQTDLTMRALAQSLNVIVMAARTPKMMATAVTVGPLVSAILKMN